MVATANLDEDFKAAIYFLSKGPSARIQFLNDDMKALLSAYQNRAQEGGLHVLTSQNQMWDQKQRIINEVEKQIKTMPRREAQEKFLGLLTEIFPEWRDWFAKQQDGNKIVKHESQADKIIRQFNSRNSFSSTLSKL